MGKKCAGRILLITLAVVLSAPGCATIVRQKMQRIPVTSTPIGARVSLNGEFQGVTPVEVRMRRDRKGQVIRIEYEGYDPVEIRPKRKLSSKTVLGNFLLGLIPGMIPMLAWSLYYDESNNILTPLLIWSASAAAVGGILTSFDCGGPGKGYELKPKELTVTLTKTVGTPRVDTIFVDPDDFKDIIWIRVRN